MQSGQVRWHLTWPEPRVGGDELSEPAMRLTPALAGTTPTGVGETDHTPNATR